MNTKAHVCCFRYDDELGVVLAQAAPRTPKESQGAKGYFRASRNPSYSNAAETSQQAREAIFRTDRGVYLPLSSGEFKVQSAVLLPFLAPYIPSIATIIGAAIGGVLSKVINDAIDSLSSKSLQSTDKCCKMLLAELRKSGSGDGKTTKPTPQDQGYLQKTVTAAQEKLIEHTGSEEAAAALVRRVTTALSYKEVESIYQQIIDDYGKEIAAAVRTIENARRELWMENGGPRVNPDAVDAYKSVEDARKQLTTAIRNGIRIEQESIDLALRWIRIFDELSKQQDSYRGQIAKSTEAGARQNESLRLFVQHGGKASEQAFNIREQLRELTAETTKTPPGLITHREHVGVVTEAYRALSVQIGATVGAVLSGEVSFKDVWESLGRGALETVRKLGRQVVDSLLGDVRDLGRGLPDVIFGPFRGAHGSIGFGGSLGFLPSFLAGGSPGGLPAGFPTFPTFPPGGGFSFGGFPLGGGSQLWNAGAATVARYLPFTAPTLASYGFVVNPVGLGTGASGGVPGVNAPPAAGFGPFSPAALGALGGLACAGEGSFTEALAAIGRGVRERIRKVGRGPLDSLLLFVRELRHRLSDAIFGKLRDAVGSFKHSIGDSFLAFFFLTVSIFPSSRTPSRI